MEAFDGFDGVAFEDDAAAHGFHAEHADALLDKFGQDLVFEAAEVRVHDVEGHLDGVETEVVLARQLEHAEVDDRVFVTREADEAAFARLLRFLQSFDGTARIESAVGVFQPDAFVELPEVEVVGLEALKGIVE